MTKHYEKTGINISSTDKKAYAKEYASIRVECECGTNYVKIQWKKHEQSHKHVRYLLEKKIEELKGCLENVIQLIKN